MRPRDCFEMLAKLDTVHTRVALKTRLAYELHVHAIGRGFSHSSTGELLLLLILNPVLLLRPVPPTTADLDYMHLNVMLKSSLQRLNKPPQ